MAATLYSNNCPRCQILKSRLDEKGIKYNVSNDTKFLIENKIISFPALKIGEKVLKYYQAILWLKNQEMEDDENE